jgi:hypothetical protein
MTNIFYPSDPTTSDKLMSDVQVRTT